MTKRQRNLALADSLMTRLASANARRSRSSDICSKISGPLLDRIDIHLDVPAVRLKELASETPTESSGEIRERVVRARRVQLERFHGENIFCNAQMSPRLIRKYCIVDSASKALLESALTRLGLSARAYDRILRSAGHWLTWKAKTRSSQVTSARQFNIEPSTAAFGLKP